MIQPLVSVVMASYNSAQYIAMAIYSVLKQTVTEIELIVVDDGSTDASPEIIHKISKIDQRVRFFRTAKNSGPAAARNLGLKQVRGLWVAIMDSDDLMASWRLEQMIAFAEADKADVIADNPLLFWDDRSRPPQLHLDLSDPITVNSVDLVTEANKCGYLKTVFRAARLGHIRYNESLFVGEDFDYYLRGLVTGATFRVYPISGYFYRKHNRAASEASTRRNVEAMLAFNIAFMSEYAKSGPLSIVLKSRENELQSTLNYLDLIGLLKNKKIPKSISLMLKKPSILLRFAVPMKARLSRLRQHLNLRSTAPNTASDLQAVIDQTLLDLERFGDRFLC